MNPLILYDFNGKTRLTDWVVVNDGVMGGLSRGSLTLSEKGHGVFSGSISLENSGGFSSVRLDCGQVVPDGAKAVVLRIKGDGKRYQFRIRAQRGDYYSFVQYFQTSRQWEEITLPLAAFYPTFRGTKLNMPNFSGDTLEEIGILIGNKRAEDFTLLIDSIRLE